MEVVHLLRGSRGGGQLDEWRQARGPSGFRGAAGEVSQVGGPGSHLVAHLARANCLVAVPEDVTELPAGAEVEVVLIEGALR